MAEHDDRILARLVFVRSEGPSKGRLDPEDVEVAGRDPSDAQHLRIPAARKSHRAAGLGDHRLEDVALMLPIEEVRGRDAVVTAAGRLFPDLEDPFGVRVGERLQQCPIHEAEDGAVGADAEGQGQHRHGREGVAPGQGAEAVADVLRELVEHTSLLKTLEAFRRSLPRKRWVV